MAIRTSIRAAALAALVIATGLAPSGPVLATDARVPVLKVAASEGTSRFIPLGVGDGIMLSGSAASAAESQQAYDLASRLVGGDGAKVVNGIAVRGRDQVM